MHLNGIDRYSTGQHLLPCLLLEIPLPGPLLDFIGDCLILQVPSLPVHAYYYLGRSTTYVVQGENGLHKLCQFPHARNEQQRTYDTRAASN